MKTEPTAIIEIIRAVALLASFAGVAITVEEQTAIAAGITAGGLAISAVLAIWNRLKVFSPKTTQKLVDQAAETGIAPRVDPPAG